MHTGQLARVKLALDILTGTEVDMKIIERNRMMEAVNQPNVGKVFEVTRQRKHYLVMQ